MRNWTTILYIAYFILIYYLPMDLLKRKMEKNKVLSIIYELLFLLGIYFIGEKLIINDISFIGFYVNTLLKWTLFVLILLKPVNIKFKIFFDKYSPKNNEKDKTSGKSNVDGGGAMIGNLERILIAILMFYGQYGAIGLVFTAKSVTRFDKITKDASFAEYYLIGSLYSMICVLLLYGLIIYDLGSSL